MKPRFSLLVRIYAATALCVTLLLAAAGAIFERQAVEALRAGVEQEVRDSLGGVDALWQSRAELLAAASALFASMSDVRAVFGTRDEATIRDTASELWSRMVTGRADAEDAAFVVTDPRGVVLAGLGRGIPSSLKTGRRVTDAFLEPARRRFPQQTMSFATWDGTLWQVVLTPVFVNSGPRDALLNILLAAHPVSLPTLQRLKDRTGADFLLRISNSTVAATLNDDEAGAALTGSRRYATRATSLEDPAGRPLGQLWAVRSFAGAEARVSELRRATLAVWAAALLAGLALSYWLARSIAEPIRALTSAAVRISAGDESVRVPEGRDDELGALARTFNRMCESIAGARAERIRREQITAIGRLAASIAHDLRNPLSAILGGAEMLAEFDLPPEQARDTSRHIQQAARRMQELLSEIGQVARRRPGERTVCRAADLLEAAVASQTARARQQGVQLCVRADPALSVSCEKSRIERVLVNLIANALEVLPGGGKVALEARLDGSCAAFEVTDDGPGIDPSIREQLFEPFVTAGKKSGLGLGLALARQTAIEHGGDLSLLESSRGARFRLRIPAGPVIA